MHFIKKGYKRFLYTNSSDPRQRVPLKMSYKGICIDRAFAGKQKRLGGKANNVNRSMIDYL